MLMSLSGIVQMKVRESQDDRRASRLITGPYHHAKLKADQADSAAVYWQALVCPSSLRVPMIAMTAPAGPKGLEHVWRHRPDFLTYM